MRRYERGYVSVPPAQQYCSASIIALRQTKPAVFLRNFDSKRAELRESLEIFRRNFAGEIDLVWIDMFALIIFQLANKIFANDLFFLRFERRFHIISSTDILSVGTLGILPGVCFILKSIIGRRDARLPH